MTIFQFFSTATPLKTKIIQKMAHPCKKEQMDSNLPLKIIKAACFRAKLKTFASPKHRLYSVQRACLESDISGECFRQFLI